MKKTKEIKQYELLSKFDHGPEANEIMREVAKQGTYECLLRIDNDYVIERYTLGNLLFYAHFQKNTLNVLHCVKVCIYKEKNS